MATLLEIEELPIRVNSRGQWLHGDEPLHPKVELLFQRSVRVNDDGTYRIEVGANKSAIEVEDVAFFVKSIRIFLSDERKIKRVQLKVSDGASEDLDPATLMQADDNVFYCRIRRDQFGVPCRFSPSAYHELVLYAEMQNSEIVLEVGGEFYDILDYSPKPQPTSSRLP